MSTTFTHVGVTVIDHEESKRFYVEALGFEPTVSIDADEEGFPGLPTLLEVEGADVFAEFLTNGPQTIELVSYRGGGTLGEPERREMNRLGLTHLCFLVQDVDAAAQKVEQFGGKILSHTRIGHDKPDGIDRDYLFCTDPNGVRIELIAAAKLPNTGDEPQLTRR
jgi:catechol 2,3-dioxygenase-like lactoylglutathione lyase family enzyme